MADAPAIAPQGAGIDPETVLVGIPALNEAASIEACLRSLFTAPDWMDRVTVVVADGGSQDATPQIVARLRRRFPRLRLIRNPERLQSAAMNRIVAKAAAPRHRTLVRCDAHALYPPNYVRRVAESLARQRSAALATVMDARGTTGFAAAAAAIVDTKLGAGGSAHRGGIRSGAVDHGHHAGIDLAWFRRIGGYDPRFSHNEDAEFDHRLRAAGGTIWLDATIRLDYTMRKSAAALARQYWAYGRGRAATIRKHRCRPRLRQGLPAAHALALLGALLIAPISPLGLIWPIAYGGLCIGVAIWATLSLRRPAGLWAGLALALMHTAWGLGFLAGFARAPIRLSSPDHPQAKAG
ncbi:MAG: glycosyltransferase family 2 protein [Pseudomonadota bacterium]